MHSTYSLYTLVHIYKASIFYYHIVYVISFIRPTCGTHIPTGQLVGLSHQVLTNHKTRLSLEQSRRTQPSSSDQSQDTAQFGKIKKNSVIKFWPITRHGSVWNNQGEFSINSQPITDHGSVNRPTCGSDPTFWPDKISPDFTIKGGLLTPFQHHPTRKNLPATTISLTTHPSHSPELTTTLIK